MYNLRTTVNMVTEVLVEWSPTHCWDGSDILQKMMKEFKEKYKIE